MNSSCSIATASIMDPPGFPSSPASSRFNYINTQNSELTWLSSPLFTSGGQYVIIQDTSLFTNIQKPQSISTIEMSVYPNPTHTSIYLTLHSSETKEANISVFDTKGSCVINLVQKVMTGENTIMIPIQNIPTGIYEVVVGSQKQKVIIN